MQTFGLFLAAGCAAGYLLAERRARRGGLGDAAGPALAAAVVAGLVGARLTAQVTFPDLQWDPRSWLALSEPGLSFEGGVAAGALAAYAAARRGGLDARRLLDAAGPALALGYALGVLGSGTTGLPLGGDPAGAGPAHPVTLYAALAAGGAALASADLRPARPGQTFWTAFCLLELGRAASLALAHGAGGPAGLPAGALAAAAAALAAAAGIRDAAGTRTRLIIWGLTLAAGLLLALRLAAPAPSAVPAAEAPAQGAPAAAGLPARAAPAPLPGRRAPDFTVATPAGEPLALEALLGKPVVLNFWATWCPPCRREMPAIARVAADMGDRVAFVGVAVQDSADNVAEFTARGGYGWAMGLDPVGAVADRYRVWALPTTFFLDRNGTIVAVHAGPLSEGQLRAYVQRLLR